ncbi:MAG: hypothetical protein AAF393_13980 [Pseudomonadota bacterium]
MKQLFAAMAVLFMAGPAAADDFRGGVVTCLSTMQTDEEWAACRATMFSRCPTETVGSPEHVACLTEESKGWEEYLDVRNDALVGKLASAAQVELANLRGQWRGYVANKCSAVAASNPDVGEAAQLGCQISEIAGFAAELAYCEAGFSKEPYCVLKE